MEQVIIRLQFRKQSIVSHCIDVGANKIIKVESIYFFTSKAAPGLTANPMKFISEAIGITRKNQLLNFTDIKPTTKKRIPNIVITVYAAASLGSYP